MAILVGILLVVLIVFAVSSGMQSYATAQQAQATIEVARVAQVNAWGNLITILTLALVLVVVVAIIAAAIWYLLKKRNERSASSQRQHSTAPRISQPDMPALDINTLIQLKTLEMLSSMSKPNTSTLSLPASSEVNESPDNEPFHWLR